MFDEANERQTPLAVLLRHTSEGDDMSQFDINQLIEYKAVDLCHSDQTKNDYRYAIKWLERIIADTPEGYWKHELVLEQHRLQALCDGLTADKEDDE